MSAVPSDDEKTAVGMRCRCARGSRSEVRRNRRSDAGRGAASGRDRAGAGRTCRTPDALRSRKVALALVMHPRTPRHIAVPLLRRMFTFDLMQVTLTPAVAADIKRAGEEQLLLRMESLSTGEKISLARRASGRIGAALLQESDTRVITPALDNAQLTEAMVVQALMSRMLRKNCLFW